MERDGILQFRGIRFAAPPVGDLRWAPPQPPRPSRGPGEAAAFGPKAPQGPSPVSAIFGVDDIGAASPAMSEDCLNLNIYTPAADGARRPVLVWLHGGSFTGGSNRSAWYDGSSFARQGLVVVTVNYRLGALGFLPLASGEGSQGNCGLLDQVAALGWVRDNIERFGGDPANVTLFGESAGAISIGCLLAMPAAAGLFHRAILQSGAASTFSDAARAAEVADRMTSRAGGPEALHRAPWQEVLKLQADVLGDDIRRGGELPFGPVTDGVVLSGPPMRAIEAGAAARVPLMIGTNRDEWMLFLALAGTGELAEQAAEARLNQVNPGHGAAVYGAYRQLLGGEASPGDVLAAAETDRRFRAPAIHLAEAQARHTRDVWMYLFTWESPGFGGKLRSCHGLEVPFAWNTLTPASDAFTGSGPQARSLAGEMHAAWAAFAATGEPGWRRYDLSHRSTRTFGPGAAMTSDPLRERREWWRHSPATGRPGFTLA